jgi:predicted DNA-binding protein
MKQVKVLIQLPLTIKKQLDALRSQGYTVSGYIRGLIERDLIQKGR